MTGETSRRRMARSAKEESYAMNESIRILIVEDLATDAELAAREINKALESCVFQRVETREDYLAALATFQPDLIVSDYQMPRFDGLTALKLALERMPLTPLIILTGAMNEDTAVECMKAGATDYVIKEHVKRLGPAVIHALEEKQLRQERRRAEEALQQSEERYRTLTEAANDAIFIISADDTYQYVNRFGAQLLGRQPQDMIGRKRSDFFPPPIGDRQKLVMQRVLETGDVGRDESLIPTPDGEVWLGTSLVPLGEKAGEVSAVLGISRDITERKRAEQVQAALYRISEAAQATQNLDEFFALIHAIIGELMPAKNFYIGLYDASLHEINFPYHVDECDGAWTPRQPGKGLTGYVLRTGKPLLATPEVFGRLVEAGEVAQIGTPGVDWLGVPLKTQRGETIGMMAVQTYTESVRLNASDMDVLVFVSTQVAMAVERKRAEETLQESEERFRSIFENAVMGLYRSTADGRVLMANPALVRMLGYSSFEELAQYNLEEHGHTADPLRLGFKERIENEGQVIGLESAWTKRDGATLFVRENARAIYDKVGNTLYYEGTVEDITEHKRAEEERDRLLAQIQEQAQRVRQIMDTVPEGVLLLDAGGAAGWRVVLANPVAEKALAVLANDARETLTHLGNRPLPELLAPPPREAWHEVKVSGPPPQTFEVVARPIEAGPAAGGWALVVREVTQERESQQRAQQQARLAAIGQLTAGIAHDFNNLLTAINGFAELGRMELPPDAPSQELLSKILHSGRRAADLIRQLLIFSRKQTVEPQVLNLNEIVSSMDKMLRRVIGEDIDLAVALTPDLWPVKVDPTQIEQVILNLAVNARDAMPNGGKLTIETSDLILGEDYAASHAGAQPGEHVLLAISDTGVGMSDEVKAHLFEPFFTTKGPGEGTGLGLSTVFGIVKQSGGNIWVYSEEGRGTTFKIYLPRVKESAQLLSRLEFGQAMPSGNETILLVEDADGVRELARRTLQNQDYTVLEARDGQEALQLAGLHSGPIHLLLTDVIMPGLNSKTLIEQLTLSHPDMKVLLMSGYTDNAIMQYGVLKPGAAFLQKPFGPMDLARKVRRVLDSA